MGWENNTAVSPGHTKMSNMKTYLSKVNLLSASLIYQSRYCRYLK